MVLILVDEITSRLSYTFDFIFKSRIIDYEFTLDKDVFNRFQSGKLNYSNNEGCANSILPAQLVFESSISNQRIAKGGFQSEDCLSFSGVSDPVASVFYVLSRYEEYTSSVRDVHNRFPFSESCLKKNDWIELAVCDRWSMQIINLIREEVEKTSPRIIPTFDIDNTYAYKLKTGRQKYLSILRDLLKLNFDRLKERSNVLKGEKDPYDTFQKIKDIADRFPLTKLFWLVGEYAEKDRNIPISNNEHQLLIKDLNAAVEVNLHPSYASNGDSSLINNEKKALEAVLGKVIDSSRQHFLRFQLPRSFQSLIEAGFTKDYSMGFAESAGFRSGTARPHFWFDLSINNETKLVIQPFVYMDGSLHEYMNLSIENAKKEVRKLYDEVEMYGGDFVFLWHNETIGDYGKWKGWSEVLDYTLNLKNE